MFVSFGFVEFTVPCSSCNSVFNFGAVTVRLLFLLE